VGLALQIQILIENFKVFLLICQHLLSLKRIFSLSHREKILLILLDPKLDSKVLAIEPNRLLKNLAGSAIGVAQIWMLFNS
jgi:hypothetical protein